MRKAPKVYVADSGLVCALLGLRSYEDILGHPGFGALWEQVVLSNFALEDIAPRHTFVVSPVHEGWPMGGGIDVIPLGRLSAALEAV
jgi:predicted AAA+ superfamily ATPase